MPHTQAQEAVTGANPQADRSFRAQRTALAAILQRQRAVLRALHCHEQEERLQHLHDRLLADDFKLLVIGSGRRGKTSIINALLGEEVLPAVPTPMPCAIKWGETRRALIYSDRGVIEIPVDQIETHLSEHRRPSARDAGSECEKLEVFWPLEFCRAGVEIIEHPGLDEPSLRCRRAEAHLAEADALLFVLSCEALGSQAEVDLIDQMLIPLGHDEIFFVCNRFDTIRPRERDRVRQYALSLLGPRTSRGGERIFFVSASDALGGRRDRDAARWAHSGLAPLETEIVSLLAHDRDRIKLGRAIQQCATTINEARSKIDALEVSRAADVASLARRHTAIRQATLRLEEKRREVTARIASTANALPELISDMTSNFLHDSANHIERWIEEYDLSYRMRLRTALSGTQAQNLAREIMVFVMTRLEEQFVSWQQTELAVLVTERLERFQQELEVATRELAHEIAQVQAHIAPDKVRNASAPCMGAHSITVCQGNIPLYDSASMAALQGGIQGATLSASKILSTLLSGTVGAVALRLMGVHALLVAPVLAGGGLAYAYFAIEQATSALKQNVGRICAEELRSSSAKHAKQMAQWVSAKQVEVQEDLHRRIQQEVETLQRQCTLVLTEIQEESTQAQEAVRHLAASREEMQAIEAELGLAAASISCRTTLSSDLSG